MEDKPGLKKYLSKRPAADLAERRRRRIAVIGLTAALLALIGCTVAFSSSLMRWIGDPAQFRAWAESHGAVSKLAMAAICAVQVVLAFIPGEPVQIAAGMAFGTWWGVLLTLSGILLGQAIVFILTKRYGIRFVELFFDKDQVYSLPLFVDRRRLDAMIFLLFFIPGAPKDLLTYAAALTPIGMGRFLLLSITARASAVIASAWGGSAISGSRWMQALWILGATALVGLAGILYYRRIHRRHASTNSGAQREAGAGPQKAEGFLTCTKRAAGNDPEDL
ncbi:MAG: TVP38/TMEM64 family protein [Oscillospiraceae bacterium]|jgi:uncharacterized membrane protein YdjX (TVP38/TMEM64 family)|nr:TVP38/TMEM64 family protein [Oscillospiraceae bacterium]